MALDLGNYLPVGRCIYCGATEYAPDSDRQLATEHIIPYSLGGEIELPEASCRACERVTGRIESIGVNAHLLSTRRAMNLQSRTPKSKRKAQILTAIRNGKSEQIELLDEEYPSVLFLPIFNEAPILRELPYRGNPNDLLLDTYRYHFDMNARMIMGKLEADILLSPKLDLLVWRRIIAKIAHATAVAELGLDGFIPLLSDVLRDPNRDAHDIQDYVGGSSFAPSDQHGHSLNLSRIAANGTMFIVVDITLFSIFEAPTYRVAVGYVSGTPAPVLPRKRPAIFDFKRRS